MPYFPLTRLCCCRLEMEHEGVGTNSTIPGDAQVLWCAQADLFTSAAVGSPPKIGE